MDLIKTKKTILKNKHIDIRIGMLIFSDGFEITTPCIFVRKQGKNHFYQGYILSINILIFSISIFFKDFKEHY